jgi:hypothetical protein
VGQGLDVQQRWSNDGWDTKHVGCLDGIQMDVLVQQQEQRSEGGWGMRDKDVGDKDVEDKKGLRSVQSTWGTCGTVLKVENIVERLVGGFQQEVGWIPLSNHLMVERLARQHATRFNHCASG